LQTFFGSDELSKRKKLLDVAALGLVGMKKKKEKDGKGLVKCLQTTPWGYSTVSFTVFASEILYHLTLERLQNNSIILWLLMFR